jgi:hypothetical protein
VPKHVAVEPHNIQIIAVTDGSCPYFYVPSPQQDATAVSSNTGSHLHILQQIKSFKVYM